MGVLLSEMLAFSPQNRGGMGNHITHPVSGPGKPLFTRVFQGLNVHMLPSVGAYIPAAACALRPPCRCRSRRPVCPAGGIVSRRRRRPAAPLYGRCRTRLAPVPGQAAKPPPGNNGNMSPSTTYSACSTHSPAGGSRIPGHSWRTTFYQPADGRTLGTGQLPGVHSSVPGLRANLARSPLDFQQPVAEAYAGRPVPVGARGAEGAAPGLCPAFRNRPGDLLHQPFQRVVGEIHSSPPPSSASASPSSSQGGLSSYSSSGISSYSPPSS